MTHETNTTTGTKNGQDQGRRGEFQATLRCLMAIPERVHYALKLPKVNELSPMAQLGCILTYAL